jgi:hypothetical protein
MAWSSDSQWIHVIGLARKEIRRVSYSGGDAEASWRLVATPRRRG